MIFYNIMSKRQLQRPKVDADICAPQPKHTDLIVGARISRADRDLFIHKERPTEVEKLAQRADMIVCRSG